ncbi:hypothetical protein EVU96_08565 [Bacillus infantis]|uniref:hypothetical protein n=1 Tax=Bacillus infantis TaxID=324767 RepID=UPI00101DAFF2|nr:hypothetical protein [Bacillus infantis]RYI30455.1 hypothetical protein EVU96_08565 [Bacillus infantis]
MKLYTYQEELLESKGKTILVNWARGAGKDVAIAEYILKHKPKSVLLDCSSYQAETVINYITELGENITLNKHVNTYYSIEFNDSQHRTDIRIEDYSFRDTREEYFDLHISYGIFFKVPSEKFYEKYIKVTTKNINQFDKSELDQFDVKSHVDHRMMLKEDLSTLDAVLNRATSDWFYREYALLDKKPKENMSFPEFQNEALARLQKQFLNTSDSKDTVLTRKNIIEMIKDLKELK